MHRRLLPQRGGDQGGCAFLFIAVSVSGHRNNTELLGRWQKQAAAVVPAQTSRQRTGNQSRKTPHRRGREILFLQLPSGRYTCRSQNRLRNRFVSRISNYSRPDDFAQSEMNVQD